METPTEADWRSDPDDPNLLNLDAAWAYKNFQGKTFDDAVRLFEDNAIHYQEDLSYMPGRVFGFYLKAFITYLMSDAAKGASDAANCFISLIEFKAEHDRELIAPHWSEIEPVLHHLAEHQDDFDADWKIYGSFRSRIGDIARFGFEMTFDTSAPEIVPDDVSMEDMAYYSNRTVPWPVALQVFRHSGVDGVEAGSRKEDILRIFGPPDATGGGEHPEFGHIPDWVRYDRPTHTLRFGFDGDAIAGVSFMPPIGSSGVPPEVEKFLSPESLELRKQLFTLTGPDGMAPWEQFERLFRRQEP